MGIEDPRMLRVLWVSDDVAMEINDFLVILLWKLLVLLSHVHFYHYRCLIYTYSVIPTNMLFQHFHKVNKSVWSWTLSTVSKMSYGAIYAIPQFPFYTVTLVTYIFAKNVKGNISQIDLKNTLWCHLKIGDLLLNAKNILQKYVNVSVNNVTFLFVCSVLLQKNTQDMKLLR